MICYDQDILRLYMNDKINLPFASDTRYIGSQKDCLSVTGAVAYNCWLEDSVFMHVAFDADAVSRRMLREAFMYPFVTCGKTRVYGMTPITSQRALDFSKKLGFQPMVDTPDFRLQVMTRQDCRWINDDAKRSRTNSRSSLQSSGSVWPSGDRPGRV